MTYLLLVLIICLTFLVGEIMLRCSGYQPWKVSKEFNSNDALFSPDSELGLKHNPGLYKVKLANAKAFITTHDRDALRITKPAGLNDIYSEKGEIWIFGCSVTHGWSLNDDETYPWLMQKKLPEFRILNFGIKECSTIQSLIQLRKALQKKRKPKYIIVAYSHLHDKRNTLLRSWRKTLDFNKTETDHPLDSTIFPCGKIGRDGNLVFDKMQIGYKAFPIMRSSALIHSVESMYNKMQEWFHDSHTVSRMVMEEFMKTCESNNIKLIVAGLDDSRITKNMLIYCKREGISSLLMPIILKETNKNKKDHLLHPCAVTNQKYADKLSCFIKCYERKIEKKKRKRTRILVKNKRTHSSTHNYQNGKVLIHQH